MLVEIWTVSIIILIITYIILRGDISTKIILKSVFPTLFANNWYMTCYLLFYPVHFHPTCNPIHPSHHCLYTTTGLSVSSACYAFCQCNFEGKYLNLFAVYTPVGVNISCLTTGFSEKIKENWPQSYTTRHLKVALN